MCTQSIFSVRGCPGNAAEEAALIGVVHRRSNFSNSHGRIDAVIVPLVGGENRYLSGIKFDILVALDLVYLYLSGGHSNPEVRFPGHFDFDLKAIAVIPMASVDGEPATL